AIWVTGIYPAESTSRYHPGCAADDVWLPTSWATFGFFPRTGRKLEKGLTGLSVGNITGMGTAGMFSRSSSVLCGAYDYSGTCKFCPTSARLCIFVVHVNPAPLFSILLHSGPLAERLQRLFSVLL